MNLTIRNIPEDVINKIRTLSSLEKRSLNNQILILLEKGLHENVQQHTDQSGYISKETQLTIWKRLSGQWLDNRETEEIIDDIYSQRTHGHEYEL